MVPTVGVHGTGQESPSAATITVVNGAQLRPFLSSPWLCGSQPSFWELLLSIAFHAAHLRKFLTINVTYPSNILQAEAHACKQSDGVDSFTVVVWV